MATGPDALGYLRLPRAVQPSDDLGGVETDEVANLEVRHTVLGDQAADVAHRVTQQLGKGLYVD
jgi:hypothetical protein